MIRTGTYLNDDARKHQHAKRTDDGGVELSEFNTESLATQIVLNADATRMLAGVIAPPTSKADLREAFVQGFMHMWNKVPDTMGEAWPLRMASSEAKSRYPDPVRPRECKEPNDNLMWRIVDKVPQVCVPGEHWKSTDFEEWTPTTERIVMWASLIANPTEVVNDG